MTRGQVICHLAWRQKRWPTPLSSGGAAGERGFEKQRAKWEKKSGCTYEPKPRRNLIGEPLD